MSRYNLTLSFAHPPPPIPEGVAVEKAEIVRDYPHDPEAFTQGLLWSEGRLFETLGQLGRSELREVRLKSGIPLRREPFPRDVWGEGLADWREEIVAVTLGAGIALRWEKERLMPLASLPFPGASWGMARIGDEFVVSDGTALLRFVDPETMTVKRTLAVTEAGGPLTLLNDLCLVKGELLANIFMTETIVRIDPATGEAKGRLDLSEAVARSGRRDIRDVLNGIAYDPDEDRLFVTGKNWTKLFQISLPTPPPADS